jgi:CubicO group peptidase (beta-lactamase class C family)
MTADTIFRIRSMTKPIVSAAAMTLYEEGHFVLSDPVSKWLPEFEKMHVVDVPFAQQRPGVPYKTSPASNPITIGHVLSHRAGFSTETGLTRAEYQRVRPRIVANDTLARFTKRLAQLPLHFEPGTAWQYGPATDVVGRLIEVISGRPLDQFLQERLLGPLQMRDTHFYLPASKLSRLTALYELDANRQLKLLEAPTSASPSLQLDSYFSATSGLLSTAGDYFRFHQMMLNGGELDGVRVLGRKTVELMTADHTGDRYDLYPARVFGLGYEVVTNVGRGGSSASIGMYGWPGAQGTLSFVDPVEEIVAVMLMQMRPAASIRREYELLQALVYQALVD